MPNDSGFSNLGLDGDLARILGGSRGGAGSPGGQRGTPHRRSSSPAPSVHTTPSLNISAIPARRSSSTAGDDNDISRSADSLYTGRAAASGGAAAPSGPNPPAGGSAAQDSSAMDVITALRLEEEAASRRAAEREARRTADKAAAEERRARLLEEQRRRREERQRAEEEFTTALNADGDGAAQAPEGPAPGQEAEGVGQAAPQAASSSSSSSSSSKDATSSFPSLSDYTQSHFSPLQQQSSAKTRVGGGGGAQTAGSGAALSSSGAARPPEAALPQPIPPPVIREVPVSVPCPDCPGLRTRVQVLGHQLDAERASAAVELEEAVRPLHGRIQHLEKVNESLANTTEQFRVQNEVLQAKAQGRSIRSEIATGALPTISCNDMIELRKEITHQDALINQYQLEDQKNTLEVKTLRQQVTELQKQNLALQKRQQPASPGGSQHNDSAGVNTSAIEATRVVKDLNRETARLNEQMRIREEEHELQLNALRKAKKAAEDKLQAVDWQRADDDAVAISNLRLELKKQRIAFEEKLGEADEKIAWYIKNQEILTKQDALVSQQGTEIETLKTRVVELDTIKHTRAPPGSGAASAPHGPASSRVDRARYIQELQQKVKGLEEIIRSKYPNSLPELIRACKPTETEVGMYRAMQERIELLNTELTERELEYEKGIRELRQATDKTLLEYKERYSVLKEEFKVKLRSATSQRIKELERKVEDTRSYYLKKVKELEGQVLEMRKTTRKNAASGSKPGGAGGQQQQQGPQHPRRSSSVQTDEAFPPQPYVQQHSSAAAPPAHYGAPYPVPFPVSSGSNAAELVYFTGEISKLRGELESSKVEERNAVRRADAAERDVGAVRMELEMSEKAKRMHEEEGARLRESLQKERREFMEEVNAANAKWRAELDDEKRCHAEEVKALQRIIDEEAEEHEHASLTPAQRVDYIAAVRRKLAVVDKEYTMRIAEMKRASDEARRVAAFNLDVQRQKMNLVIQAKNNEIERFRISVDSLLEELNTLRGQRGGGLHSLPSTVTA